MTSPQYWKKAVKELSVHDPIMKKIIQNYPGEILKSRGNAFETLMRSIVGQQISVKAAASIWKRVCTQLSDRDWEMNPQNVLFLDAAELRACGLSERKVLYVRDLALHFDQKKVAPEKWASSTNEEIIQELICIKGIGRWTAEMFLIFHLLRHDVFPKDDLGLQKAISKSYGVRYPLTEENCRKFAKKFSPWGSVATWYLWRSLDPLPVEY
jgi:DNA-3-methyladenine glycosylase II